MAGIGSHCRCMSYACHCRYRPRRVRRMEAQLEQYLYGALTSRWLLIRFLLLQSLCILLQTICDLIIIPCTSLAICPSKPLSWQPLRPLEGIPRPPSPRPAPLPPQALASLPKAVADLAESPSLLLRPAGRPKGASSQQDHPRQPSAPMRSPRLTWSPTSPRSTIGRMYPPNIGRYSANGLRPTGEKK